MKQYWVTLKSPKHPFKISETDDIGQAYRMFSKLDEFAIKHGFDGYRVELIRNSLGSSRGDILIKVKEG